MMKELRLRKDVILAMAKVTVDDLILVQDDQKNVYTVTELPGFTIMVDSESLPVIEGTKELVYVGEKAYLCDEVNYVDHMHVLVNPQYVGSVYSVM